MLRVPENKDEFITANKNGFPSLADNVWRFLRTFNVYFISALSFLSYIALENINN